MSSHTNQHRSQEQRILWLLESSKPSWTPADALSRISLQYCRAIRSLRKAGWQIANKVEIVNGRRYGFYRLGPAESRPALKAKPVPAAPPGQAESLFGDLRRYPD